jgi:hypothetical protein
LFSVWGDEWQVLSLAEERIQEQMNRGVLRRARFI